MDRTVHLTARGNHAFTARQQGVGGPFVVRDTREGWRTEGLHAEVDTMRFDSLEGLLGFLEVRD